MRLLLAGLIVMGMAGVSMAWERKDYGSGSRPYEDSWGHNYKRSETLYKDSDGDGTINKYDYNDRDSSIRTKSDSDYQKKYGW